jgi:hypothetical protein
MLGRLLLGHSSYSNRCCHDMDCYPADEVGRLPEGTPVLSRGNIRIRVPRSFPIEVSPSGKPRFCCPAKRRVTGAPALVLRVTS